jgi:hypothetical protein
MRCAKISRESVIWQAFAGIFACRIAAKRALTGQGAHDLPDSGDENAYSVKCRAGEEIGRGWRGGGVRRGAPAVMRPFVAGDMADGAAVRICGTAGKAATVLQDPDAVVQTQVAGTRSRSCCVTRGCAGAEHCRVGIGPSGTGCRSVRSGAGVEVCAEVLACCTWLATSWRLSCEEPGG